MKVLVLMLTVLLSGCSSLVKELSKDPANICAGAVYPYGTVIAGRVNTPGATLDLNGTSCKITAPPAK